MYMNDNYKQFIESFEESGTIKVVTSYAEIGEYDYTKCTPTSVEKIILSMNPKSPREITTICYVMKLYAKFIKHDRLYAIIENFDRNDLWKKAKPNAKKRHISYKDFDGIYNDIGVFEPFNSFYYQTLFKAVYEGIYNEDMSVIKNLRVSDVHGNIVTLREDNGHTYELRISEQLAEDLKELSAVDVWEQKGRYSICQHKMIGKYSDSCFKTRTKEDDFDNNFKFAVYAKLRKIAKEYAEIDMLPSQLFVSGLMYRITVNLVELGISVESAFSENNKDKIVSKVIVDELQRCNYHIKANNFRELVNSDMELFVLE